MRKKCNSKDEKRNKNWNLLKLIDDDFIKNYDTHNYKECSSSFINIYNMKKFNIILPIDNIRLDNDKNIIKKVMKNIKIKEII